MFNRILIANRGEIACRVIDTCRRLGVETVAVHSDVDAGARHVAMADLAVPIGGAAPVDSYLRGDRIVAAARETGAEAIHPGYGFLSENADFAAAVADAGLAFVGPSARAIAAMGRKDAAKAAMEAAGVPVVPGYHGEDQSDATLAAAADNIGFPVLIKAVSGGGGKGMRRVDGPGDFAAALAAARAEASGAFGDDRVLIERHVARPRHVEVQIFGDGTRALHLFERDCSLQRRHQKVLEEAPAPGMTPALRAEMGQAAVRAAEAIGYAGAGTVEFIADGSAGLGRDGFFFMEMNTRLQVEHPVTEAVTGIDLVEWQLRVAAGERLPCAQEDLRIDGHAVEVRLYAEDAAAGFLPATGRLAHLVFPPGLRAETGVRAGDEITPHYDPMIAKLIAHGPDRDSAFRRLSAGLARTEIAGTVTNLALLKALVDDAGVRAGEVETGLIAARGTALTEAAAPGDVTLARAALAATGLDGPGDAHQGFALWSAADQPVPIADRAMRVRAEGADRRIVTVEGREIMCLREGDCWRIDGARAPGACRHDGRLTVFGGAPAAFDLIDPLARGGEAAAGADLVVAPMPGRVVRVDVVKGDAVGIGQPLATLEAMKMEHTLRAGLAGSVAECLVSAGQQVAAGDALFRLAPDGSD